MYKMNIHILAKSLLLVFCQSKGSDVGEEARTKLLTKH